MAFSDSATRQVSTLDCAHLSARRQVLHGNSGNLADHSCRGSVLSAALV